GLILWDHGSGASGGVCYDEMTDDALYMPEIYNGLKQGSAGETRKPFYFIGFDACLMASYELCNHLEGFADYLVASEELEPGTGWSYDGWLPTLNKNPGISMEELGPVIVESFLRATLQEDSTDYATLSVIDLNQLEPLRNAVEAMGASLKGQVEDGDFNSISRLRQNVRSFGEISDSASDMVDLTTFAEVYSRYDAANAQAIKNALADAVVYSNYTSNLSGVTGLSILAPFSTREYADEYMPYYEALGLSPNYTEFVKSMLSEFGSGSTGFSFGALNVSQESIQSAQIDWFSQYAQDQDSYQDCTTSLWDSWYGDNDMTEENVDGFSLGAFLGSVFGDEGGVAFNNEYDDSQSCLWGDTEQYSDTSAFIDNVPSGGFWGSATQGVTLDAGGEEVSLSNPFEDTSSEYAYTIEMTEEQLNNLATAEANLMMDVSDPDFECYVELGYVQDVIVNWDRGKIYGLFDGTWATLDGQMVCMYDQIVNERYVRSLIPIKLNDKECYLLVIFDNDNPYGYVAGATEGYTESGAPARGTIALEEGDRVIPMYELLYWDENEEMQSEPFEGEEIIVGEDKSIPFAYAEVESDADYVYGFCLTDVYGDYEFTDFITLSY
ncbi:MAG: clostripain-related cysteine peptidase, partial [Eubacteriales bacterium]|nr:clostripain-related cysteine peptidase [Eubacteriales bacterium]